MIKKITVCTLLWLLFLTLFCEAQIKLETRSLLNNKVEILAPDYFKPMTADMMALKYPNTAQQPDLLLTDENAEVNLLITLTKQPIQASQMGQYKDFMIGSLKKTHPDAQFMDSGVKIINGKSVGYFKMMSNAIDQKVFVYYFFTNLDGKLLVCTFNCTEALLPKWKDTADAMMASLKIKK
jgi:hypothetical protein